MGSGGVAARTRCKIFSGRQGQYELNFADRDHRLRDPMPRSQHDPARRPKGGGVSWPRSPLGRVTEAAVLMLRLLRSLDVEDGEACEGHAYGHVYELEDIGAMDD